MSKISLRNEKVLNMTKLVGDRLPIKTKYIFLFFIGATNFESPKNIQSTTEASFILKHESHFHFTENPFKFKNKSPLIKVGITKYVFSKNNIPLIFKLETSLTISYYFGSRLLYMKVVFNKKRTNVIRI